MGFFPINCLAGQCLANLRLVSFLRFTSPMGAKQIKLLCGLTEGDIALAKGFAHTSYQIPDLASFLKPVLTALCFLSIWNDGGTTWEHKSVGDSFGE